MGKFFIRTQAVTEDIRQWDNVTDEHKNKDKTSECSGEDEPPRKIARVYVADQSDKLPSPAVSPAVTGQKQKRLNKRTYVVPSGFEKEINRYVIILVSLQPSP